MNRLSPNHHIVKVSRLDCAFYVRFKHPLVLDFVVHVFGFYEHVSPLADFSTQLLLNPAVQDEAGAVAPGGLLTRQEQRGPGDLVGLAVAALLLGDQGVEGTGRRPIVG